MERKDFELEMQEAVAMLRAVTKNLLDQQADQKAQLSLIEERLRAVELRLAKISERTVLISALAGGGVGSVIGAGIYKLSLVVFGGG